MHLGYIWNGESDKSLRLGALYAASEMFLMEKVLEAENQRNGHAAEVSTLEAGTGATGEILSGVCCAKKQTRSVWFAWRLRPRDARSRCGRLPTKCSRMVEVFRRSIKCKRRRTGPGLCVAERD